MTTALSDRSKIHVLGYAFTLVTDDVITSPADQTRGIVGYCQKHGLTFDIQTSLILDEVAYHSKKNRKTNRRIAIDQLGIKHVMAMARPPCHLVVGHMRISRTFGDLRTLVESLYRMNITMSIIGMDWVDTLLEPAKTLDILDSVCMFDRRIAPIKSRCITAPIGYRWTRQILDPEKPRDLFLIPCMKEQHAAIKVAELMIHYGHNMALVHAHCARDPAQFSLRLSYKCSSSYITQLWIAYCLGFPKIMPTDIKNSRTLDRIIKRNSKFVTCEEIRGFLKKMGNQEWLARFPEPIPSILEWTQDMANGEEVQPIPPRSLLSEAQMPSFALLANRRKHLQKTAEARLRQRLKLPAKGCDDIIKEHIQAEMDALVELFPTQFS